MISRFFGRSRASLFGLCFLVALLFAGGGFLLGWKLAVRPTVTAGKNQVLGIGQNPPAVLAIDQDVEFKQFWDLWQLLKQKYYEQPVKDKSLFYGAMEGMAASLGDPYTDFFEPKIANDFQQSLAGKFEGIGAEIGVKNKVVQIVAPLPDSPAEKAGLLAGDIILKVDKKEIAGMTIEQVVTMIRGPKGTHVVLTVLRPQKKMPFDVSITRDEIRVKSVHWKMLPDQLALITVANFNNDTQDGFSAAVAALVKKDPKGIILDLRNNPGGYLDTALFMAGEWVGDATVVKERRQGKIVETLKGTGRKRLAGVPTVVLVNQGSASASEIVAGALQDVGVAKLVGMKTFGKGSVQEYESFNDGSAIKITIAEWLTPNERAINKVGLEPDVIIDRTTEDYEALRDPQLEKAKALLLGSASTTAAK